MSIPNNLVGRVAALQRTLGVGVAKETCPGCRGEHWIDVTVWMDGGRRSRTERRSAIVLRGDLRTRLARFVGGPEVPERPDTLVQCPRCKGKGYITADEDEPLTPPDWESFFGRHLRERLRNVEMKMDRWSTDSDE